jgi:hypothetical protein
MAELLGRPIAPAGRQEHALPRSVHSIDESGLLPRWKTKASGSSDRTVRRRRP